VTDLEAWLRRQAAREQRIVTLEQGLLGDRLWRYSAYRLRFFFAGYLVESAAHAVAVLYLFRDLGWHSFVGVVIAQTGTALASALWWGALEAMRAQVRDLHRSGRPHRIAATVGGWLTLSLALAALVVALAVGWLAWFAARGELAAVEAYVAVLLVRCAIDIPVRTYHSGVYALRRIYKPLPATIGPELVSLAVMVALWPVIGLWALVVAGAITAALASGLTVHYTRRVYHFLGFAPSEHLGRFAARRSLRDRGREMLAGGAAHGVMALDSLVVLALLFGARSDSTALVVLFLSMPTIRAGADWARLMYFDLKRLELRLFTNLRRRFERQTLWLSLLLGVVFWAVAAGIATAFYGHALGGLSAALLLFFVARSLLARAQIQAFAESSYAAVIGTGAACAAGLVGAAVLLEGETARMAAVGGIAALTAATLEWLTRTMRARGEPGVALLTLEWLARLGHLPGAVRVGSARIANVPGPDRPDARSREDRNRWRLSQLAEQVAHRLGPRGAAAWVGPDRLVWFEMPGPPARVNADWLQRTSGGLLMEIVACECPTGEEALLAAGRAEMLGHASAHLLRAVLPVDADAAVASFARHARGGLVYAPDRPVPAAMRALSGNELRAILVDAVSFARDLQVGRRRSEYDVTSLCAGGELIVIFVAELGEHRRAVRHRWHHHVTALNVRGAIGGLRPRRGRVGTPRVRLGDAGARQARTQPVMRGRAT